MDHTDKEAIKNASLKKAFLMLELGQKILYEYSLDKRQIPEYIGDAFCVNATLFRGVFHPSPVIDLIVGNTRRGRLKKNLTSKDILTHRYLYARNNTLTCVETYHEDKIAYTEYLYYKENKRIGITIDAEKRLSAVSEEVFENGRLVSFSLMNCVLLQEIYQCYQFRSETYDYDAFGLVRNELRQLFPTSMGFVNNQYLWERKDSYLVAYENVSSLQGKRKYIVKKKRKAIIEPDAIAMPQCYI